MATLLERNARKSSDAAILREIHQEPCNLAIWERPVPVSAMPVLSALAKDVRFTCKLKELGKVLPDALKDAGMQPIPEAREFIADVTMLADEFCAVMRLSSLEVRIEIITTNSCRKFHADYVTARLISTYVGSGTQWLDREVTEQMRNGDDPERINSLSAGDVGLFKGKLATQDPAIHRSPPIEGTGEKRLLVVLNPPEKT